MCWFILLCIAIDGELDDEEDDNKQRNPLLRHFNKVMLMGSWSMLFTRGVNSK